jgi:hypothetical protein
MEKITDEQIESLLFKITEKPKNLHMVKISNVFDNRYRINVWTTTEQDGLIKNKIDKSYFAKIIDKELHIIQG